MGMPSFEVLIGDCQDAVRDIAYQIAAAPPHADTRHLRQLLDREQKALAKLRLMRVAYAPNPNSPLS